MAECIEFVDYKKHRKKVQISEFFFIFLLHTLQIKKHLNCDYFCLLNATTLWVKTDSMSSAPIKIWAQNFSSTQKPLKLMLN